jgi:hypothetical protein
MSTPGKKEADLDGGGEDAHLGGGDLGALYERTCNLTEVVAIACAVGYFMLVSVTFDLDSMKQQALSGMSLQLLQTVVFLAAGAWVHATACLRREARDAGVPGDDPRVAPRKITPVVTLAFVLAVTAMQTRSVVAQKRLADHTRQQLGRVREALQGVPGR